MLPHLSNRRLLRVLSNGFLLALCGCQVQLSLTRVPSAAQGEAFLGPRPSVDRLATVDQAQLLLDWQVMQRILGSPRGEPYLLEYPPIAK